MQRKKTGGYGPFLPLAQQIGLKPDSLLGQSENVQQVRRNGLGSM